MAARVLHFHTPASTSSAALAIQRAALGNKLQILALHDADTLRLIEAYVDELLPTVGAPEKP